MRKDRNARTRIVEDKPYFKKMEGGVTNNIREETVVTDISIPLSSLSRIGSKTLVEPGWYRAKIQKVSKRKKASRGKGFKNTPPSYYLEWLFDLPNTLIAEEPAVVRGYTECKISERGKLAYWLYAMGQTDFDFGKSASINQLLLDCDRSVQAYYDLSGVVTMIRHANAPLQTEFHNGGSYREDLV